MSGRGEPPFVARSARCATIDAFMSQEVSVPDRDRERGDALVIFGITGDVARKQTLPALYRLERREELDVPVVGSGRSELTDGELRELAREAVADAVGDVDDDVFERLAGRLLYVAGDSTEAATVRAIRERLGDRERPVFYLAVPPNLFAPVVRAIAEAGWQDGARVIVEKPFGHDLASARELDEDLQGHLRPGQIYRLDHFLGLHPVHAINTLRFANEMLEPVWNRQHVRAVHVSLLEDFGVEDRGAFFDPVGALRDVVQNHLLQVLALVLMEPPAGGDESATQDRKLDVLRAIPEADLGQVVRGQYEGYRDIEGVEAGSDTETYIAMRLGVESWRWDGVPVFIRAGKCLGERVSEARLVLRTPPRLGGREQAGELRPNAIKVRLDPRPGAAFELLAPRTDAPGLRPVRFGINFDEGVPEPPEPYERLLLDGLHGNPALFAQQAAIEEMWRIVQPILDAPPPVEPYRPGSMGPASADRLVADHGGWPDSWLPDEAG
jgi:glucose-6-phosphate 1-dehydrogenase